MIFCQMLLNKGEYNGTRILGSKTVEFMNINHLSDALMLIKGIAAPPAGNGFGFGFGVVENVELIPIIGSAGSYYWGGIYKTFFQVDPSEQLILLFMTQLD